MILTEDEKRELYTKWCCYPSELVNKTEKLILSKIGEPVAWHHENHYSGNIPLYKSIEMNDYTDLLKRLDALAQQDKEFIEPENSINTEAAAVICEQRTTIEFLEGLLAGDGALITGLRDENKEQSERITELEKIAELYERSLKASWPEGAMGDAFEYWNEARKLAYALEQKGIGE